VQAGAQAGLGGHRCFAGLLNNKHSCEEVPSRILTPHIGWASPPPIGR
jgi:hypothetical protein